VFKYDEVAAAGVSLDARKLRASAERIGAGEKCNQHLRNDQSTRGHE